VFPTFQQRNKNTTLFPFRSPSDAKKKVSSSASFAAIISAIHETIAGIIERYKRKSDTKLLETALFERITKDQIREQTVKRSLISIAVDGNRPQQGVARHATSV